LLVCTLFSGVLSDDDDEDVRSRRKLKLALLVSPEQRVFLVKSIRLKRRVFSGTTVADVVVAVAPFTGDIAFEVLDLYLECGEPCTDAPRRFRLAGAARLVAALDTSVDKRFAMGTCSPPRSTWEPVIHADESAPSLTSLSNDLLARIVEFAYDSSALMLVLTAKDLTSVVRATANSRGGLPPRVRCLRSPELLEWAISYLSFPMRPLLLELSRAGLANSSLEEDACTGPDKWAHALTAVLAPLTSARCSPQVRVWALHAAASTGSVRLLVWLHSRNILPLPGSDLKTVKLAAKHGHVAGLDWLSNLNCCLLGEITDDGGSIDGHPVPEAASMGMANVVEWYVQLDTRRPLVQLRRLPYSSDVLDCYEGSFARRATDQLHLALLIKLYRDELDGKGAGSRAVADWLSDACLTVWKQGWRAQFTACTMPTRCPGQTRRTFRATCATRMPRAQRPLSGSRMKPL
jgi:hypothetical protein